MNLYLVGLRGSGKTTLAPMLADKLAVPWLDMDRELVQRHGQPVRLLFQQLGEPGFRELEANLLADLAQTATPPLASTDLLKQPRVTRVIATGGGVILRATNRELLRQGFCAWLQAPTTELARRLRQDTHTETQRPSLTEQSSLETEMAQLLQERQQYYQEVAQLALDTMHFSMAEMCDQILIALEQASFST